MNVDLHLLLHRPPGAQFRRCRRRARDTALLLLGLAFATGGCASKPEIFKPIGTTPIVFPASGEAIEVHTRLGYELKLTLPPPRKDGYIWEIAAADPRFLPRTSEFKPLGDRPGAATVTFYARHRGRVFMRFFAVPPTPVRVVDPGGKCEMLVLIE